MAARLRATAVDEFRAAIADAGPTFDDPRVPLARAMFALGLRGAQLYSLLRQLSEDGARLLPRTCDLVAELLTEQGDLNGVLRRYRRGGRLARAATTATSSSCCSCSSPT